MAGTIDLISTINGTVQSVGDWAIASDRTEINTSTVAGQIEAYGKSSVVQTAIDIKARYHSALKMSAQKENGDWIVGNYGTAIEKATVKKDLEKIKKFNEKEGYIRFQYRLKANLHIFGECFVYKMKIVGFPNKFNYYILPYNMINPIYGANPKYDIYFKPIPEKYQVTLSNGTLDIYPDEVYIFRDGIEGFGAYKSTQSRLVGLKEDVSALLSANQMFTQLIADGGARGIIGLGAKDSSMITNPLLGKEKYELQESLKGYGKLRGELKYLLTKGTASYIPLTSSITDMQLPENLLARKINIYNAFGIPNAYAINESRFKVAPEARKELFTSSVIPESKDVNYCILDMVQMPERDWQYLPDASDMDFFQEPLLQSATALQMASQAVVPLVANNIYSLDQAITELTPYMR